MPEELESPFLRPLVRNKPETVSYLEPRPSSIFGVIGAIAICHLAGLIGVLGSRDNFRSRWYRSLNKPEFMPPNRTFRPVWSVLYTMMGLALHQLWRQRHTRSGKSALRWFAAQLGLNAAWTPTFFGGKSITGGMTILGALATILPISVAKADRASRPAGLLLLPYLGWVAFATVLNAALIAMNPRRVRKEVEDSKSLVRW